MPQTSTEEEAIRNDIDRSNKRHLRHAQLFEPVPLSIVHLAETGDNPDNLDIYVAGRVLNILNYDRRLFPQLRGTIYSGARLSSLTSLGYSLLPNDQRVQAVDSGEEIHRQSLIPVRTPFETTLIACGEYEGEGSLELYVLGSSSSESPKANLDFSSPLCIRTGKRHRVRSCSRQAALRPTRLWETETADGQSSDSPTLL